MRRYLWDGVVITREQALAAVDESIASFAARRFGFWALELRGGGALVGFAGLRPIPDHDDIALY